MNGVNIIILFVAIFGFLPLIIFWYKRKRANRILTTGRSVVAVIFNIFSVTKGHYDVVHYYFTAVDGKQYQGKLTTTRGSHKVNETIEVFYLPDNPKYNTVQGAWKSIGILVFGIIIAIVMLFMSYKLYEMYNHGNI